MDLHGGADTLALARQKLADIPEAIEAIDQIDRVVSYVQAHHPEVSVYIDLTELRGFPAITPGPCVCGICRGGGQCHR